MDQRITVFLDDLRLLAEKHGLSVQGCGCCGSPFLCDRDGMIVADTLQVVGGQYETKDDLECPDGVGQPWLSS